MAMNLIASPTDRLDKVLRILRVLRFATSKLNCYHPLTRLSLTFSLPLHQGATLLIGVKVSGLGFSRLLVTGYRLEKVLKALRVLRGFEWVDKVRRLKCSGY